MTVRIIVSAILIIVIVCVFVGALLIWKPQFDPVETPKSSALNSELVAKGAELAAIGNCATCHTTPGGESYRNRQLVCGGIPPSAARWS